MSSNLLITGATLVDPHHEQQGSADIIIRHGVIGRGDTDDLPVLDAKGLMLAPGLIDIGTFSIDLNAMTAGGITAAALMPDQSPPLDNAALVQRAATAGKPAVWIHPIAAASTGLAGGDMAEIGLMKEAGAIAIATGRQWIADSGLMLNIMTYAAALDLPVITHAEDAALVGQAVATTGPVATWLGLSGAPAIAESLAIARDLMLAEQSGAHVHFRQVTTARGFDLIRAAKQRGIRVTCGITPAHLLLSENAIGAFLTFTRLSPPLRSEADRLAAIEAVRDGTVDLICSGHDPHGPEAKRLPFAEAQAGMAGAATLLALSLALVRDDVVTLPRLMELLSATPARLFGLAGGSLHVGAPGDLVIFDPHAPWQIDGDNLPGKAGNTPFDGLPVQGIVRHVVKGGRIVT